ncbi:phosphoribosyltransferase [Desulfomicrobium salsuginis]
MLDVKIVTQLFNIFQKKGWSSSSDLSGHYNNVWEAFCKMFEVMDKDQVELIIQLMDSYLYCNFRNYQNKIQDVISKYERQYLNNFDQIFILPLVDFEDTKKRIAKSGSSLVYATANEIRTKFPEIRNVNPGDSVEILDRFIDRENSLIIFVDDFIGTGSTAIKCLKHYKDNYYSKADTVNIFSLVVHTAGLVALSDLEVKFYYSVLVSKGISDNDKIIDKEKAIEVMLGIEKNLSISEKYSLGFMKSEALVTMERTPNNTFPIFWCNKLKNGDKWNAPFPR